MLMPHREDEQRAPSDVFRGGLAPSSQHHKWCGRGRGIRQGRVWGCPRGRSEPHTACLVVFSRVTAWRFNSCRRAVLAAGRLGFLAPCPVFR